MRLLLADDEPTLRITLADELTEAGHEVSAVADGAAALAELEQSRFDVVLTDLQMPGADGFAVLDAAGKCGIACVVLTGAGSVDSAVAAMKGGAYDYLQKPFPTDELLLILERLAERQDLRREVQTLRETLQARRGFGRVIGESPAMRRVLDLARQAAASDATVVLVGESGTGKEVLSRAIHEESRRHDKPFIPMSCATLSESLQEDELFGHEKGAFTDARQQRPGLFEMADQGTLLLDDIDDMRPGTQVKLLRVLQEREFTRIGGTTPLRVDIRVIAASKVDLLDAVGQGQFREDLYYRLNVIQINLPPLRDRPEDIAVLVEHFCGKHETSVAVAPETLARMSLAPWPGNVRQLENAVRRAIALRGSAADLPEEHLLSHLIQRVPSARAASSSAPLVPPPSWRLVDAVHDAERAQILQALAQTDGNRTRTAELLGISRKNLWEKMKTLGIDAP